MKWLFFYLSLLSFSASADPGVYQFQEKNAAGMALPLSTFKGKVLLIVNIASQCGYTPQLSGLEALAKRYSNKGLVVLGVPANDFGGQTPEDDKGVVEFCQKNYGVTFPLLSKASVSGSSIRPLYRYLTQQTKPELRGEVAWNFEKFLVDKKGILVARFKSNVTPESPELIRAIEAQLR